MTPTDAIQRLIDRNQALVNKSGVSVYTRESDDIINALLDYMHAKEAQQTTTEARTRKALIILKLLGLERFLKIDADFLQRYIDYDVITGIDAHYVETGEKDITDCQLHLDNIEQAYKFYITQLRGEIELFKVVKANYPTGALHAIFPEYWDYCARGLSDTEVLHEIKQALLYNYIKI